jgi:hypothetical protein
MYSNADLTHTKPRPNADQTQAKPDFPMRLICISYVHGNGLFSKNPERVTEQTKIRHV